MRFAMTIYLGESDKGYPGIPPPPGGSPSVTMSPPSGSKGHPFSFIFFTSALFTTGV